MNKAFKRFASFMLALVLVMCSLPLDVLAAHVISAAILDGKVTVTGDADETLIEHSEKDGVITAIAKVKSTCAGLGGYTYTATTYKVIVENTAEDQSTLPLRFKYAVSGSGSLTIDGVDKGKDPQGTITQSLQYGQTITFTLTCPAEEGGNSTLTLSAFELVDADTKTVTVNPGTNGTVSVNGGAAITTATAVKTTYAEGLAVKAVPSSGYSFIGWQDADGNVVSLKADAIINPEKDMTINAVFATSNGQARWLAGERIHTELSAACTAAAQADNTVVLLNSGTLNTSCTIPQNVTVVIPYDEFFTAYGSEPEALQRPNGSLPVPTAFRTLTVAAGVKLTVAGKLEAAANHYVAHGGQSDGGRPVHYYGHIAMGQNSEIVVAGGGKLFAWGYITGSGSVTAESGATIYEKMQVADYRGGTITSSIVGSMFPFNQYYIQNVEVRETIKPGATLICHAGIYGSGVETSSIDFMGSSSAMFALNSGSATKYYDAGSDRLIIDVNGDVSMKAIEIMGYNTSKYILPLNNNITVNINEGSAATISQDIALLPGTQINVKENATLNVANGKRIFLVDADNWGNYCFGAKIKKVSYVASLGKAPTVRTVDNLTDAQLNINGDLQVNGQIYATAAGAQFISSDRSGTVTFVTAAPTQNTNDFKQSTRTSTSDIFNGPVAIPMAPAVLRNGDSTTIDTKGIAAGSRYNYCATCDKWYMPLQVTYDANAGVNTVTGEMAEQNLAPCHDKKLAKNLFESESMNFKEWNTAADGKGTVYADEGELTDIKSNVLNLFAQWIVKATWMKGSEKLDETDVLYNTVPAVTEKDASKPYDDTYHYQTGWSTTPDGEAQDLTAITAHTTYYAVYTPVEHSYSLDTTKGTEGYEWSADGKSCTAHAVCSCGKTITASAVISSAEKTPAACGTKGTTTYTATFADVAWAEIKTRDVEDIPALTHKDEDKDHNCDYGCGVAQGEHADGTDADHKCDYCGEDGLTAHEYTLDTTKGKAGYAWAEDGKSCTAYGKCVCGDTVELAATMSSSVTTPGTCKTEEVVTWKAAFAETWATEQSKPVTGVKNMENHTGTEVTYSIDGMTHSAVYNCCGSEFVTGQEHTFEEGKCICGADEPVKGDVDLDGKVEASDLTTLCRHVAKIEYVTDEVALHNADVTGDGVLAADDLTMLARYVAKIIDSLD